MYNSGPKKIIECPSKGKKMVNFLICFLQKNEKSNLSCVPFRKSKQPKISFLFLGLL